MHGAVLNCISPIMQITRLCGTCNSINMYTHSTISYSVSALQHWIKINKPFYRSMEWPIGRRGHAATYVSGYLLVIVGGIMSIENKWTTISDCWIHDLTTMKWKKVICVVFVYQILYVWFWYSATTP